MSAPALSELSAMAAPDHDDFDDALEIEDLPFSDGAETSEATEAPDDPSCAGSGPTVWYSFTASRDLWVEANTFGSDYDTTLSAYIGSRGALSQVECNDDAEGLQSRVILAVEAGQTVYFMAGAFGSGPGGNLVFNVIEAEPPPPPLRVGLTLDRFGSFDPQTGRGTVRGTVTCSRAAFVDLNGILTGRVGRSDIEGFLWGFAECDGTTAWEAEVFAQNVFLTGGSYDVSVAGFFWDPVHGDAGFADDSGSVNLRRASGTQSPDGGAGRPPQEQGGAVVFNSGAAKQNVGCTFRGYTSDRGTIVHSPQGYSTLSCEFSGLDPIPETEVLTGWRCSLSSGGLTVQSRWVRTPSGEARLTCQFNGKPDFDAVVDFGDGWRPAQQGSGTRPLEDFPGGRVGGEVAYVGLACSGMPLLNDVAGRIALVERGACTFPEKFESALAAGAVAVVVFNSLEGGEELVQMGGEDIALPGVFVGHTTGLEMRDSPPVEVTLTSCRASGTCRGEL